MWGKLLGGVFGFMVGGPLGAVLGAALGHTFDRGMQLQLTHDGSAVDEEVLSPGDAERVQMAFFTATFSVLGHVAKADGRVDPSEIALAESVMSRMSLPKDLRDAAIKLFNEGKQPTFELAPLIIQFRRECQRRTSLYRIFMEIQLQGALADGELAVDEERVLREMGELLGFSEYAFRQLEMLVRFSMGLSGGHAAGEGARASSGAGDRRSRPPVTSTISLQDARALLGVKRGDDKATVKRAYRRLMSQHHPDKLVSKGLPEEMIRVATDKTQQIQRAYKRLKSAEGW